MKKIILIILCICFSPLIFAQYKVTIEAFVLDKKTNQPIPYVNIGFVEKSIGTVSNEDGGFRIIYHEDIIGGDELLQFSALGYKTLKVKASQLVGFLTNTDKFYLTPEPLVLDEVFITNEKRSQIRLGDTNNSTNLMGYWKDKIALGGEIATKIKIKSKDTKLLDLRFNIVENLSDSLRVRVNVYQYKKRYPRGNLLKTNIYHTISKKSGEEIIDLKTYNISVDHDIVIGLELIEVFGDNIGFAVSANKLSGTSFIRYISQDKWMRYAQVGVNFNILTSFPDENHKEVVIKRAKPQKVTLYYDVSKQMKHRDANKEFKLLSNYLKSLDDVEVEVIKFNNGAEQAKVFNISKGKSFALINYLKNSDYDGASNFKNVLKTNAFNADIVLLFTNGMSHFSPMEQEVNTPSFCINSLTEANHYALQKTAFYADGHYINLNKVSEQLALSFMLNEINDKTIYNSEHKVIVKGDVHGKVSSPSGSIQGATIRVENSFIEAQSDVDGLFDIDAKEGDVLVVSYLGMLEKKVELTKSKEIRILMIPDGELLEAIVLKGEKKRKEDVETGYGKSKKDAVGYSVSTLTSKDIKPHHNTLLDVLRGRFAGIKIVGSPNDFRIMIRGAGSFNTPGFAIFDIDGMIYLENPPHVDPQNIESITILKSLAAVIRYGSAGAGGVIKIKNKFGSKQQRQRKLDTLLVKGNDYTDEHIQYIGTMSKIPGYLLEFEKADSYEAALEIYNKHKTLRSFWSIPYYLDVSNYFIKWNKEKAYTILSNIASVAYNNPKALKIFAYKLEEFEKYEEAKYIYERIAVLRPSHEQSYRDLALIYNKVGNYESAMKLYKKMMTNAIDGLDVNGLLKTIERETMHLLAFHKSKVNYSEIPENLLTDDLKFDLRIVFEWNDPETEFILQFVNPKKKFFKWFHTKFDNKERLLDEIKKGYHIEEFVIDDAEAGEWIINIECLSKEDLLNPTYLKYTVFKNYGLANESKTTKVIKLQEQRQKVTLDSFLYQ